MRFTTTRQLCAFGAIATLGLAACSGSGTSPEKVTTAKIAANVLQLSVGTANIFGDDTSAALTGINAAVTYRQPAGAFNPGASGTLLNSPTFTLPTAVTVAAGTADSFDSTIATGPAPGETTSLTSTPQTATSVTSFGISGGAYGLGLEPFNSSVSSLPDSNVPYAVPLFDALASAGDPNAFEPWGGPPAFDPNGDGLGTRDGNVYPSGVIGVSEGLDVFENVTRTTGTYGLAVSVPANNGTVTQSASATLASAALLPAITPAVPVLDGLGGGTFTVTLPAGVTEAYVQVTDVGPDPALATSTTAQEIGCNTASLAAPVYYTFEVTASGSVTLGDAQGPGTPKAGTPSICTPAQNAANASSVTAPSVGATDGDTFAVQTIGFDYPAFEASYPSSLKNPAPALAGANGQSDITISSQAQYDQSATDAGAVRRTAGRRFHVVTRRRR